MAQCGYSYTYVQQMPTWLFWSMIEAKEIEKARSLIGQYQAAAVGAGSFAKEDSKDITRNWQEAATASIRPAYVKPKRKMTRAERAAHWGGML